MKLPVPKRKTKALLEKWRSGLLTKKLEWNFQFWKMWDSTPPTYSGEKNSASTRRKKFKDEEIDFYELGFKRRCCQKGFANGTNLRNKIKFLSNKILSQKVYFLAKFYLGSFSSCYSLAKTLIIVFCLSSATIINYCFPSIKCLFVLLVIQNQKNHAVIQKTCTNILFNLVVRQEGLKQKRLTNIKY